MQLELEGELHRGAAAEREFEQPEEPLRQRRQEQQEMRSLELHVQKLRGEVAWAEKAHESAQQRRGAWRWRSLCHGLLMQAADEAIEAAVAELEAELELAREP